MSADDPVEPAMTMEMCGIGMVVAVAVTGVLGAGLLVLVWVVIGRLRRDGAATAHRGVR
jgi:hypothetical protein